MRAKRVLHAVDTHCEGLPIRIITGGVAPMPGETMEQRRQWFINNSDNVRTLLMHEPRGHSSLSGAILQPPTRADADWGVLFIEVTGVLPMCGAGTMAVATTLVETGMVEVSEPTTIIKLDTPTGLITVSVAVNDGRAESVTFENVASYAHAYGQEVDVPGLGRVEYDMAFGGNFYAFVESEAVGIAFERESREQLEQAGTATMHAINEHARPEHPESGFSGCEHVVFLAPGSDARHTRHALINRPGWLDRSPGGTGTSARMAQLHGKGELDLDTEFVNESFIGTSFTGRLRETTTVDGRDAVIPTVTGRSWLTGMGQYVLDPTDPFPAGYTV